ncbi:GNAT family N-acetyltransferase [Virgibacillus phasianinus]|uniref:GNAT family N-acetyltransferase n=2 Tax=Virgibacillus phasianinus TaxID=2017483 RepID=A0A220U721_9BACI|nr:GNAT family N-acetyltransferase [Virgibacillus phasianinus]ASK63845.1 GNAT family N-acetyltransferase [Virgibacillus phasianinus]
MILQKGKLLIRKLKDSDKQLLVKWLSNPMVLKYYEGRDCLHDLEMVNEHFYSRKGDQVTGCIVEYDGTEIGFIQFYQIDDAEREEYGYTDMSETIYGTDQFIGEIDYWNQGIGTFVVRSMADFLMEKKAADRIVMDPQICNNRAISCYEKCKFNKVKLLPKHERHEGEWRDCWLMEYRK